MSTQRQLFGTDGIRGVAGEFPLTLESTYLIGRALGHDLLRTNPRPRVVIGQDTRESSRWIADRVSAGLASLAVEVHSAGVITTPGIAYLARSRKFDAGVVISASHNPWTKTESKSSPAMDSSCPTRTNWRLNRRYSRCCKARPHPFRPIRVCHRRCRATMHYGRLTLLGLRAQ